MSITRYIAKASSNHQPNQVPGILIIINPKQPNLPICSTISTALLFHLFSKPFLHFNAYVMFGIIIITMNTVPKTFIHSIIFSPSNSKLSLYIESIITEKYENFYTPPDPNGIGGFFALKSISEIFSKKYPDKSSSQFKQVKGLISS